MSGETASSALPAASWILMKMMKIGPYTVNAGKRAITKNFALPEFTLTGPGVWMDIDWTDDKFPVGWCAGLNFGKRIWYFDHNGYRRGPLHRWNSHWSWNAPHGEPNRLSVDLPWFEVRFSCFTWWKEIVDSVEESVSSFNGKPIKRINMHRERAWPHLEDGWPLVRFQRRRFERGEPDDHSHG